MWPPLKEQTFTHDSGQGRSFEICRPSIWFKVLNNVSTSRNRARVCTNIPLPGRVFVVCGVEPAVATTDTTTRDRGTRAAAAAGAAATTHTARGSACVHTHRCVTHIALCREATVLRGELCAVWSLNRRHVGFSWCDSCLTSRPRARVPSA